MRILINIGRRIFYSKKAVEKNLNQPLNLLNKSLKHNSTNKTNKNKMNNDDDEQNHQSDEKHNLNKLSQMQYKVTQEKYTESPFTGKFNSFKKVGTYECIVCNTALFKSDHKFDSGCGWPAFFDSIDPAKIKEVPDESHGMSRIEVLCANCDAHLGHVFPDGPKPTRRRFCINSVSMRFIDPTGNVEQDDGSG